MNHKRKQKPEESQGLWAGIKRIWGALKANPLGALVIALGSLLLVGILNSFLGIFYDSCSKAMGNASVGFWHKFVDLYYINAAKAELTDVAETIYSTMFSFIIAALWAVMSLLKFDIERLKRDLRELDDIEEDIEAEAKMATTSPTDNVVALEKLRQKKSSELRKRTKDLRDKLSKDLKQSSKNRFWCNLLCFLITLVVVLQVSFDLVAYNSLKKYKHRVSAIRPFVTAIEHQTLDRQWILMRSKLDHQKIMEKLEVYEKRAADQTRE